MPAPYIWINGFPGVGKLTAARHLQRLIPRSVLIDNHSLIDVVKLPRDHPDYNAKRERVREEAFQRYVYPEDDEDQLQRVVIFTDFFTSGKLGSEWSIAHKIAAQKAKRPFFPVYLHCEKGENLKRVVDPSRTQQGRTKLVDSEMIEGFIEKYKIFQFETGLDVDVTGLQPEETAKKIADWVLHGDEGGHDTCRRRKIKCDEAKPVCGQCNSSSRYCVRPNVPKIIQHSQSKEHKSNHDFPDVLKRPREALKDTRIAALFHQYLSVATWYDLGDPLRHFSTTVPILALEHELLFCAVIALSAIRASNTSARPSTIVATSYHSRCVKLLIGLDDSRDSLQNGVALATACLLRSYEILSEETDPNIHLQGAYSFASSTEFLHNLDTDDLHGAGFWNYLREDITFSLFQTSTPLKLDLRTISSLHCPSHRASLHKISLILGHIINASFAAEISAAQWRSLNHRVKSWLEELPLNEQPLCRKSNGLEPLPKIWFLQDHHASAMHYFLVACAILCLYAPQQHLTELYNADQFESASMQQDLLENLATDICGIAFTTNIDAVLINAYGPITYCAGFIRNKATQNEVMRYLVASKKTTGWPVERMIRDLQARWEAHDQIG